MAAAALLIFLGAAVGTISRGWLAAAVTEAGALDPGSGAVVDAAAQEGSENVLLVAADRGPQDGGRADTLAVAHVPAGGGTPVVLSFAADLEINRPPCQRFDPATGTYLAETVPAEARTALGAALDVGGPRCLTRVVQQLSGMAITRYVGLDLGSVAPLVDAAGGSTVCLPRPVEDALLGSIVPRPGSVDLNGSTAAALVTARDVAGEDQRTAAQARVQRQQAVLAGVLASALGDLSLLDVGKVRALRAALGDALATDGAGLEQVLALSGALAATDEGVRYVGVPADFAQNARGLRTLRDAEAGALFAAVRRGDPLPDAADDASAGPQPSQLAVDVLNASDRSGLANEVAETLGAVGFGIGEVGSAPQPTVDTVVRFSPDQAAAAGLLAASIPSAQTVPDPGSSGVLQLVLGRSFDDVVRAPLDPAAASTPTVSPTPPTSCPRVR